MGSECLAFPQSLSEEESAKETAVAEEASLKRKVVEDIICSASSTVSRAVAVVFSFPNCVRDRLPNRLCVHQLQLPFLVETFVSPTLDAILGAEKLVRGSVGDLWRNTFRNEFHHSESQNTEQASGNIEEEKTPNLYYKIQRFLFSGNFSTCLFSPCLLTRIFLKERRNVEDSTSTHNDNEISMSSYSDRTVYVTMLPLVQLIRSFSCVPFRFPNSTLFSSHGGEDDDFPRLTANMGEESFDDLLSLQETSTCFSRPADSVLIERCTAKRTYQLAASFETRDTCKGPVENDSCVKTDTMLFRYNQEYCSICLENYVNGDVLRVLPCLHFFHVSCIDNWLMMDKACPLCKWDIDRGLLYSSWEDSWTSAQSNYSSTVATSSAIDLIEQEPEINWGEWFRSLFSP
jgi:hypothetical protein